MKEVYLLLKFRNVRNYGSKSSAPIRLDSFPGTVASNEMNHAIYVVCVVGVCLRFVSTCKIAMLLQILFAFKNYVHARTHKISRIRTRLCTQRMSRAATIRQFLQGKSSYLTASFNGNIVIGFYTFLRILLENK